MADSPSTRTAPKAVPVPRDRHLRDMADCIRFLSMDAVQQAKSGHPGAPMGMADIATVLFKDFLRFDAADPHWIDRDRFILSNGHGSMLLYSLLYLTGYEDMPLEELRRFRQVGSRTPGHPEYRHADGIELTTGPLGQGVAEAVGMALGERIMNARFGDDLVDHHARARDRRPRHGRDPRGDRHRPLGDGQALDDRLPHDHRLRLPHQGRHAEGAQRRAGRGRDRRRPRDPGLGVPALRHPRGPPRRVAGDRRQGREGAGRVGRPGGAGAGRVAPGVRAPQRRRAPRHWRRAITAARREFVETGKALATRQASGAVIDHLFDAIPELLGGSADLTPSNNTKAKRQVEVRPGEYEGSYVHYGVREHGMAAAMNGIALHGGLIPYGGTFLCFSDYCRPAIRLAAMMRIRTTFVMTHDSIGLGEDGPTHQPVEHLAALRAIPHLAVYRPGDPVETAECWESILDTPRRAALLALSRQPMPLLRHGPGTENKSARGAYVLLEAEGGARRLTLMATGSELHLAVQARDVLQGEGIPTAVVSMPCRLLFEEQDAAYKRAVMGETNARVAVEAAVELGWERYLGFQGRFVGMHGFGESGKIADVYEKFDITTDAVVRAAREVVREVAA
jgi:transketolase